MTKTDVFLHGYRVGDAIKFLEEKQKYTIQACNHRFLVCTKPLNAKKTVLYSIVDFQRNVRGTENLVFCMGFETVELCREALKRLESGESDVSFRTQNYIELHIESGLNLEKIQPLRNTPDTWRGGRAD